jgi:hypothetical protein
VKSIWPNKSPNRGSTSRTYNAFTVAVREIQGRTSCDAIGFKFEITPAIRDAVQKPIKQAGLRFADFVFSSNIHDSSTSTMPCSLGTNGDLTRGHQPPIDRRKGRPASRRQR